MTGYLYRQRGPVRLYLGDAAAVLATLPESTVDCFVTSPPYWGHRIYSPPTWQGGDPTCTHPARPGQVLCWLCGAVFSDSQYGLEATVDEYVDHLVAVFDQIRRVLTPHGTCWLNLGDSYSAGTRAEHDTNSGLTGRGLPRHRRPGALPAKQLVGVPWRVAFALQERSEFWLRQAIIWHKPNAMPESVTDRPFSNYEHLFLLARSPRYFFDLDPIRIPLTHPDAGDGSRVFGGARKAGHGATGASARRRGNTYRTPNVPTDPAAHVGRNSRDQPLATGSANHPRGRNPGSVWSITTRPNRLAHFAAFPIDLPLRAIAVGCPPGGLVCDPFSGIATTGLAALRLGRRYIGIDINAGYHDLALQRLEPLLTTDPNAERL